MAHDLKPYENITRVFWIRIELKEDQGPGGQSLGDIKDVISGDKQAIYKLCDIICFIIPYVENIGIRTDWLCRFMIWINKFNLRKHADGITLGKRTRS
jgi:hypothetical protein